MFMEKLGLNWRDAIVSACLLFCAIFLYRSVNTVVDVDDAYISYRYAANMAEGNGPVLQ